MIEVDVEEVIRKNLRNGETGDSCFKELIVLAVSHPRRDLRGANVFLKTSFKSGQELKAATDEASPSSPLRKRWLELVHNHMIGYFGEISVHSVLHRDWHEVFERNALNVFSGPDGELADGQLYDVKTRSKNRWGLSVSEKQISNASVFVLCWFHGDKFVDVVGYATKVELLNAGLSGFSNYTIAVNDLHSIQDLIR